MSFKNHRECDRPVSSCEMIESEVTFANIKEFTFTEFGAMEERWGDDGSPWRQFYAEASKMENRVIAWNTNKCVVSMYIRDMDATDAPNGSFQSF